VSIAYKKIPPKKFSPSPYLKRGDDTLPLNPLERVEEDFGSRNLSESLFPLPMIEYKSLKRHEGDLRLIVPPFPDPGDRKGRRGFDIKRLFLYLA
jgi:hypothetical protein